MLINAYNAFMLKTVVEQYPIDHVLDDLDAPFEAERWSIGGTAYSLNQIENDLIRAEFDEPRIHFAVNCGALSCPDLRSEAYRGDRLESQLAEQEQRAFQDPKHLQIEASTLRLSQILEWYGGDFVEAAGSVEAYVAARVPDVAQAEVTKIEFLPYDWTLNDAKAKD